MKYLLVIDQIKTGGAEKILIDYYCYLVKKGWEVKVFSLQGFDGRSSWTEGLDITYGEKKNKDNILLKLFSQFRLLWKMKRIIRNYQPDIVFSFLEKSNFITTLVTPRNIKKVVTVHNILSIQYTKISSRFIKGALSKVINWMYNRNTQVVAVSKQVKDDLVLMYGVDDHRIHVINNYVDKADIKMKSLESVSDFIFHKDVKYVLNIGRFSLQKSQHKLINAFHFLIANKGIKDVHLVLLGEGEKEKDLRDLVDKLGMNDYITFIPFNINPYKYMSKVDLLVLSSVFEGFPIVVSEMSSLRIPFVGSDKAIPREMFQSDSVWTSCTFKVCPDDDSDTNSLAQLIFNGLYNEDLRNLMLEDTSYWEKKNNKSSQFELYDEHALLS